MRRTLQIGLTGALTYGLSLLFALPAEAHAFGRRYDLPVPLWLYLSGAAAAVALSFVVAAVFVRTAPGIGTYPRVNLLRWRPFRVVAHRYTLAACRLLSVALLVLVLATGFFGTSRTMYNWAPTFVWIIWWVGLAYVCALAGNLWALVNPWKIVFNWAEQLYSTLTRGRKLALGIAYPRRLGVYPAVVLFLAFAWMEHAYPSNAVPRNIAWAASVYSGITWIGMFVFGREAWLRGGEAFSVTFWLLSRFSPLEVRVVNSETCASCAAAGCRDNTGDCVDCYDCFGRAQAAAREWNLRPYAVGLATGRPVHSSVMVFIMLLLSTLALDGFLETPMADRMFRAIVLSKDLRPLLATIETAGGDWLVVVVTLLLVLLPVLFLAVYLGFAGLVALMIPARLPGPGGAVGNTMSVSDLARLFVVTLLPIAIAYHLAHYLSFFLINGQEVVRLASDPFGFGWNVFGTASRRVDIGIVDAGFAWYTSVIAIVGGHIVAVYLAHVVALNAFKDVRVALRSQYPLIVLMVSYTVLSLWILAQPIVQG